MCTVSWLRGEGGYWLFSNRDEKLTRAEALAPEIYEHDGVRWIAPLDGDHLGTWIGVNELGISMALLNGPGGKVGSRSRGLLLMDLLSTRSLNEAKRLVVSCDLEVYSPFQIVILMPGVDPLRACWDTGSLEFDTPEAPLISSSFDRERVIQTRRELFVRSREENEELCSVWLRRFHASHNGQADAYSPCMHRPDAETVSFTAIHVTPSEIQLMYKPGAPCRTSAPIQRSLPWAS